MVYNQEKYNAMKSAYDRMTQEQKQQTVDQYKDNAEYQQFAQDYAMWGYGKSGASTPAQEPSNPAPVGNNQQNQTPANGQNWGNGGENQQSLQNQETSQPQGQPSIQDMQKHQFGYQTDENYRKQRDTQFAQQLYQSNPNTFDYNAVFNYVKSQAPQVSQGEISNTVKNIQRQWLQHSRIGAMGTASVEQIRNGLLNGQFSQSDLEILRTQNPEKYQEYLAHDEKMNAMSNAKHNAGLMNKLYNWESVKGEKTNQDLIMEAMEKFFGNINYNSKEIVDAYKEAINSSEIQKWNSKMLRTQKEMDEIDDDLDSLRDDLKRQYPWISKAQLNALVYDRSYKSMKRKNELHRDYIQARGEVQFLTDLAWKNLEADLKRVELQRAEFTDKYNALGFAKGILEFETPQQKRDAELDQIKKKYQLESELTDINSKDPQTQRTALMKALDQYYKDFWSIILRPQSQVVDDILALAKKEWISVGEAMRKNFTEPLQKKDGYKKLMNKQYGISNEPIKDVVGTYNGESVVFSYDKNWHLTINKPLMNQTVSSQAGTGMTGAGLRNNNPGNIKDMNFGNVIGKDNRGFAQFATPEDGFDALVEKVKFNQTSPKSRYYGKTIAQYFQMYAPSSDGNNPKWYAQDVANRCWVSINTPISQVDTIKFAAAIAHHDSGYNYATYGKFRGVGGEVKPTEAELAYYNKGATGIDPTGKKGITQKRYNEISDYLEKNKETLDPAKQRSLDIILGSKKFTKDQESSIREAIANWSDAKTVILNNARNLMDSWTIKDVAWYENSIYQLKEIKKLLSQYYAKWWDTWIFTGNYEKIMSQLWKVNNPNLKGIAVRIASALQIYRKDITGVAFSSQEARDIADIFPWIDKNKELNEAIINARIESMQASIDSSYGLVLGRDLYNQVKMIDIASFYAPWANVQGGSYNLVSVPR